ncbi:MAG: serine/threonine-protein kinase [Myxococcota bacterium]
MPTVEPTIETAWETLADGDPSATIRPETSASGVSPAMVELLAHPDGRAELAFGDTIGTGGMGIVRAAEQVRLGRTVAVKSIRPEVSDQDATRKLLAEAWMTGSLEHPNIVPVYDIAVDAEHTPHIVMKRVTGVEWESVMDDAGAVSERFGTHDLLAWNLGILVQVCNAVHFAHSRGVVHRDLKPQNVMIGAFGEVYLVDWGIAASLHRDAEQRIPHVSNTRIAGTPRYMAPEMVRCEPVSIPTDVYLLGGVLHRVLTGSPPHRGWSIREILDGALGFEARFGPDVPAELADLVRDAMKAEPSERIPTAEAFRQRIVEFLEHRGSSHIAEQARVRLQALHDELAGARDRTTIYGHLGACRFGFQEALSAWPGNPGAQEGLRTALTAVLCYELDARDPRAASLLVSELGETDPTLLADLERLRTEVDAQERKRRALEIDRDPRIGQRTRVFVVGMLAGFMILSPLSGWYFERALDNGSQIQFAGILAVVICGLLFWARESFLSTPINRTTAGILLLIPITKVSVHLVFMLGGADFRITMAAEALLYANIALGAVVAVAPRILPTALAFLGAALGMVTTDIHPLLLVAGADAVLFVNALVMWLPGLPKEPTLRPDRQDPVG